MALVIAHRGGASEHPENTMEAFVRAVELGADMVELDCKLTSDGVVVVLHDLTLRRHWRLRRAIVDMSWAEVARLRRGAYRVPRLSEVLDKSPVPLMVDVPSPAVAEASAVAVAEAGAMGTCLFAGPAQALELLRRQWPEARLALTWERRGLPAPEVLGTLQPQYFNPHWRLVGPALVSRAHQAGMSFSTWTVNRPWLLRRALRAGVDAVITDDVRLARAVAGASAGWGSGLGS